MAGKALESWQSFKTEITSREDELAAMLPRHVSRERFMSSAVAAVKQNPDLLKCTPRSMMTAVTRSAQDGLLPDGREGVITAYKEKQKDGSWQMVAQWNPMTHGLRKRARELDSIVVDAQVVHENDQFEWEQGDEPRLVHKPASLGTDRGEMIGAYAVYKRGGDILHREVMSAPDIEKVRSQSKQPNGLLWSKFTPEAWRKTVIRRGFKSVPCSEPLQNILHRDDSAFDFEEPQPRRPKMRTVSAGNGKPLPPVAGTPVELTDSDGPDQECAAEDDYAKVAKYKTALIQWFPTAASRSDIQSNLDRNAKPLAKLKETHPDVYAEIMDAAEEAMRALPETAPKDELQQYLEAEAS